MGQALWAAHRARRAKFFPPSSMRYSKPAGHTWSSLTSCHSVVGTNMVLPGGNCCLRRYWMICSSSPKTATRITIAQNTPARATNFSVFDEVVNRCQAGARASHGINIVSRWPTEMIFHSLFSSSPPNPSQPTTKKNQLSIAIHPSAR